MTNDTEQKRGRRGPKPSGNARVTLSVRVNSDTIKSIDKNRRDESRGQFIERIVKNNAPSLDPA